MILFTYSMALYAIRSTSVYYDIAGESYRLFLIRGVDRSS